MYSCTIHTDAMRRRLETVTRPAKQLHKGPKETGIIVPEWALKKIMNGRQTQLRVPVFPVPEFDRDDNIIDTYWSQRPFAGLLMPKRRDMWMECPFGTVGDRLWVREATIVLRDDRNMILGYVSDRQKVEEDERMMPANHMRRAHCRTILELVSKPRVEQQQLILTRDCLAEGVYNGASVRAKYIKRYEKIHGEGSWALNPWVWRLEFKVANA